MSSTDSDENSSGAGAGGIVSALLLLPLGIIGVYAYVDKALVGQAIANVLGQGAVAAAATNAFWVIGVAMVALLGAIIVLTVAALLAGLVKRQGEVVGIGVLGLLYLVSGATGAITLFSSMPLLVGFFLATNLIIYVIIAVAVTIAGVAALILM